MKIRNKLIMAFVIMIGLPFILIATTTGTIIYYTIANVNNYYDVETTSTKIITNPNYFVLDSINGLYEDLKVILKNDPDRLLSQEYVKSINRKLEKKSSFLVVLHEEEVIFVGDRERLKQIQNEFPMFSLYTTQGDSGLYFDDSQPFLLRKTDFNFRDQSSGSVLIVTNMETFLPQVKRSLIHLVICIIGIICFTAFFLVMWLYRGMVRPLNTLRTGIYRMKNGDLDFEMKGETDDEIGRICDDFEDMRRQVKILMEERLEYEEQMKMMISNISHDLKTPITAIKGYSEGIMDGVADTPEKMDKYLKTIYTKANDMTYLVDELSFYAKIDTNKIPYNFTKVNLDQYFTDCMNDLVLDLEVKNIELSYANQASKDIEVMVDIEQLKRVINNIIGNSVKYMNKDKGKIEVILAGEGDYVTITVKDNGKGVAKKELKKIFERFYRTDQSRNSAKNGSGLGLAIAKKIIHDHGGEIWADGEEGSGLSVIFTLQTANKQEPETVYKVENRGKEGMVDSKIKN